MKRILCSLLVATLPFGSVLADAPKEKNAKGRPPSGPPDLAIPLRGENLACPRLGVTKHLLD